MNKISVIILAAGQGSRMNLGYNKMFYIHEGKTIIQRTVQSFAINKNIADIIIVANHKDIKYISNLFDNKYNVIEGGIERYESVNCGLKEVTTDYVLIHDGARCNISQNLIDMICRATIDYNAAFLGVLSKDTIHLVEGEEISDTLNRNQCYIAQTPQGFQTNLIKEAYDKYLNNKSIITNLTDDVMLVSKVLNVKSKLVNSDYSNIKITTIEDTKCL